MVSENLNIQTTELADPSSALGDISHKRISAFGKKLSVIRLDGEEFLIGVQIATLLKRETFNMYRSMKIKNISIQRANAEQVDYLCKCNAVRTGTHSVTLIPYEAGLYFIADAIARQKKTENFPFAQTTTEKPKNNTHNKSSFVSNQPKLHRRKAHPWNVHRSIKPNELLLSEKLFADFNTPIDDIKAKKLAIAKHNHDMNYSLIDNRNTKEKRKNNKSVNNNYDPFNSLLFAAGSLLENSFDFSDDLSPSPSPPSSPSSSMPSSPSHSSLSSVSSSTSSSVSSSLFSSPQSSPLPSGDHANVYYLPQFNLGIFSNNNNNSQSSSTLLSSF